MADAEYTRRTTEDGEVFDVTPSSQSAVYTTALVVLGIAIIVVCSAGGILGFLFGLAVASIFVFIVWRDMERRKPVTLIVGAEGLRLEEQLYPLHDIAELYLKVPNSPTPVAVSSPIVVAGGTGALGIGLAAGAVAANVGNAVGSASYAAGSAIGAQQRKRSLSLQLRKKSTRP